MFFTRLNIEINLVVVQKKSRQLRHRKISRLTLPLGLELALRWEGCGGRTGNSRGRSVSRKKAYIGEIFTRLIFTSRLGGFFLAEMVRSCWPGGGGGAGSRKKTTPPPSQAISGARVHAAGWTKVTGRDMAKGTAHGFPADSGP